jgi:uncharacterized protein (DUF4415 family)
MMNQAPTDWKDTDALDDDDIELSERPSLTPSFFENDKVRQPPPKITVALPVDADVLAWFRAQGAGWEKRMAATLRLYVEAHKGEAGAK